MGEFCSVESGSTASSPSTRRSSPKHSRPLEFWRRLQDESETSERKCASPMKGWLKRMCKGNNGKSTQFGMVCEGMDLQDSMTVALGAGSHEFAVTSEALSPLGLEPLTTRYFFEVEVLDIKTPLMVAFALGFVWEPVALDGLLNFAEGVPHEFMAGHEPPQCHFCGEDLGRPGSWRPLMHLVEGDIVGAELVISWRSLYRKTGNHPTLTLTIFQNKDKVAEVSTLHEPSSGNWLIYPGISPHGIVDVTGSVRSVRLL